MRRIHAEIINSPIPTVHFGPELVQLTGQVGGFSPKAGGRLLDGRTWDEYPTAVETVARGA